MKATKEGKMIRNYVNPFLPLMPAPTASVKEETPMMVCGFCGGRADPKGKKAVRINGKRVHPLHKSCIASAKRPLFNMDEKGLQVKP